MRATKEQLEAFIAGLEKLTEETGVVLNGCGCCDSPYLHLKEEDGRYRYHIDEEYGYVGFVRFVGKSFDDN